MRQHNFIPSEQFAQSLMGIIDHVYAWLGITPSDDMRAWAYLISIIIVAIVTGLIIQRVVTSVAERVISRHWHQLGQQLTQGRVLRKCGRVFPPLVLLSLVPFVFDSAHPDIRLLVLLTIIYSIITLVVAANAIFTLIWGRYNTLHNDKNLPLRGILDITRGGMWVVAVIVIISLLVHKSPLALLTGLGAFVAVLLLIFKNSILGLVAGVQLSDNDMLRVGDWISVPGTDVNGIVMDVSLVVVKVRNWNNTVSMLPPYSLVSGNFTNWRYMKTSGSRQIEMSVPIDINTVRPLSDAELADIQSKVPLLRDFIDIKLKQRAAGQTHNVFNTEAGVDGSIDTNLGLLRAYTNLYLRQHPYIYHDRMMMTRILQPTPTGFPLQIFAYLTTSDWPAYEGIMADLFEHITAIAPTFSLAVYEQPSARSVYAVGANPQPGAPYYGTDTIYTATPDPSTNTTPGIIPPTK